MRIETSEINARLLISGPGQFFSGRGRLIEHGARVIGYNLRSNAGFAFGVDMVASASFGEIGGTIIYDPLSGLTWPAIVEAQFDVENAPIIKMWEQASFQLTTGPTFVGVIDMKLWINVIAVRP